MAKRFSETPKPIRTLRGTVPENVERALEKAMAADSSKRFATTAVFAQALLNTSLKTPSDTQTLPNQVISAAKSVAVLPFANVSAAAENEYFTDGMAEEI